MILNGEGFLASRGFYDFAGSTIVHSTGGWVALALVIVVGPRLGRFSRSGKPLTIQGSNLTLSALGVLILWFGWLGFNGGSAYNFEADIGIILSNTLIAGSTSLVLTLLVISRHGRPPAATDLINGALCGLVGITASANAVSSVSACAIGAGSAVVTLLSSRLMLRYRLDDVVGAVPVHLAAGIWGTLAVGLFGKLEIIGNNLTRLEQIEAQLLGIFCVGVWAFGSALLLISAINRFFPFRVSQEDESLGLNISEHGASSELYELIAFMKYQSDTGSLNSDAPADLFTESGIIGMAYNHVMDRLRHKDASLQESNRQLEAINEELRAYDQLVAHDLKNPIAAIRSYSSLVESEELSQSERQHYAQRIRRSSEDALKIIHELLNFARANSELDQQEHVDLRELVYNCQIQLDRLIQERDVQFSTEYAIKSVWFNSFALHQVVVNLISNAIKYSGEDTPPQVRIRFRHKDVFDLIEIEDNGVGMSDEQLQKVFEKHSRLHTGTLQRSGYGIGLFSARKLIQAAGGEIHVRSEQGCGSCFTLKLTAAPSSFKPPDSDAIREAQDA